MKPTTLYILVILGGLVIGGLFSTFIASERSQSFASQINPTLTPAPAPTVIPTQPIPSITPVQPPATNSTVDETTRTISTAVGLAGMVIIAAGVMAIISAFVNIGTGTSSGGILIGGILALLVGSIGLLVAYLVIQGIFSAISTI